MRLINLYCTLRLSGGDKSSKKHKFSKIYIYYIIRYLVVLTQLLL